MKSKITDNDLAGYLSGTATNEERKRIEEAVAREKDGIARLRLAEKLWKGAENNTIPAFDAASALEKVNWKLASKDLNPQASLKPLSRIIWSNSWRIAAMVLIVLGIYWLVQRPFKVNPLMMTISTGINEKKELTLPDCTHVSLNISSSIQYPAAYSGKTREVRFEGEAYFEVAKDKRHPFLIHTAGAETRVLGTAFNLRAVKNEAAVIVTVSEGRVALSTAQNKMERKVVLEAGHCGTLNQNTNTVTDKLNTDENFLAWKTGKLVFRDKSLEEVVIFLADYYHHKIVIGDSSLSSTRVNITFDRFTLAQALKALSLTLDLKTDSAASSYQIKRK